MSRLATRNNAIRILCLRRARIAYSEHVGVNLHLGRITGEILRLYSNKAPINIFFIKIQPYT